jgi:hypothetical protein
MSLKRLERVRLREGGHIPFNVHLRSARLYCSVGGRGRLR